MRAFPEIAALNCGNAEVSSGRGMGGQILLMLPWQLELKARKLSVKMSHNTIALKLREFLKIHTGRVPSEFST